MIPRVPRFFLLIITLIALIGAAVLIWTSLDNLGWMRWVVTAGLGFMMSEAWRILR